MARSKTYRGQVSSAEIKESIKNLMSSPAVRYVGGAIVTTVLAKIASNMASRYPHISNLLKENFDFIETKLGEFRENMQVGNDSTNVPRDYTRA